ncbi:nuclear transport factor 2 family protein [Candidatus Uabimicrobium sp. HlEnr_7]|uniref:nuclear transport factor 2 family protein n=1 Tax=Candidatus Uabimicrobium helgolandensis TaxID=3095367 RepID=UPI0035566030
MKLLMVFILFVGITLSFSDDSVEQDLHTFVDAWHHAAAVADEKKFFGSMDENSIYIGTDATERWTKPVFQKWCKFAFARKSAWTFIPLERELYIAKDKKYAWFDETLNTWMGICRGSGVVEYSDNTWKIKHYHLAVTIPNELITEFTDLVKQDPYQPVVEFDTKRSASKDLAYAILHAKKNKKRILIEVGEKDCMKCQKFFAFIDKQQKIKNYISENYVVLRVSNTEKNRSILAKYSANVQAPFWFTLNHNAELIKMATSEGFLEQGDYDANKIILFLRNS